MFNKIMQAAIAVTVINLLSKVLGFLRDIMLADRFGASSSADAYVMAQSIIGIVTGIFLAALGTSFIPVMSEYLVQKTRAETARFLNAIYSASLFISLSITIIGLVFSQQFVHIFAPNFDTTATGMTVRLVRIMLPTVVLTALITLNNGNLQNHKSYIVTATLGFPMNVVMILYLFLFTDRYGIQGLGAVLVLGTLIQLATQLIFTRKLGFRVQFVFDLKNEGVRRVGRLVIPVLIGSGIEQINIIVDRVLASGLATGSVAALSFATRLGLFVISLFSSAIYSVFYASMSNYISSGNNESFKRLLKNTINISVILTVPAMVGIIILRLPIVQLIYQRGLFDNRDSVITSTALYYFTLGVVWFLIREVLTTTFYALKDTRVSMINGAVSVGINVVLAIFLVKYMGIGGLTLATAISAFVSAVILFYSLQRKIGNFGFEDIFITLFKVLGASTAVGFIVHYSYHLIFSLTSSRLSSVSLSVVIGIVVYAALIWWFKLEETRILLGVVSRRRGQIALEAQP